MSVRRRGGDLPASMAAGVATNPLADIELPQHRDRICPSSVQSPARRTASLQALVLLASSVNPDGRATGTPASLHGSSPGRTLPR